ncbi:MAG: hypothetical protein JOZ96_28950 [Acidobacteria bacterium]|nr:hypothetical protein [Acidobacteriota bacterium]
MSNSSPVTFEPNCSIQDNLESKVTTRLAEQFPLIADHASLIRWCADVQAFTLELLKAVIVEELQLRFKSEFVVKPLDEFKLKGARYRHYVEWVNAYGREGVIDYGVRQTDGPGGKQKLYKKIKRLDMSLTANRVQASTEEALKGFLPVVTDIAHRIVRAANGWTEERLTALIRSAGSQALRRIRELFVRHFGDYANEIFIYPYADTGDGFVGAYMMDEQLFGTVADLIKRGASNQVSRSQQLAAVLETSMGIELTESRKALARREPRVVGVAGSERLYELKHGEYHKAEDAIYHQNVICHPIVFSDEIDDLQLVVCYSLHLAHIEAGRIPREIEGLRRDILEILRSYDLRAPILRVAHRLPNPEESEVEDLRAELRQLLIPFLHWRPPTSDPASVTLRIQSLTVRIQACAVVKSLREAKLMLLDGPSLTKLKTVEHILNEP